MDLSSISDSSESRLLMLAPSHAACCGMFRCASRNDSLYGSLQSKMQRLRGMVYLQDGAIDKSELTNDGRHILAIDEQSWHLLTIDSTGSVVGCIRFLQHHRRVCFDDLRSPDFVPSDSDHWGGKLRAALEKELSSARNAGFSYVEVGGWAVAPEIRGTTEFLRSLLSTYAWSRMIGGALGLCAATERNGSSSILRRIGGRSIQWDGAALPAYFDHRFNCQMHLLSFDSRYPNPKYEKMIENLQQGLRNSPVICRERYAWQANLCGVSLPERHDAVTRLSNSTKF
jgi:hypothetical protein